MEDRDGRTIVRRHGFGAKIDISGSLQWLDDGSLMYPIGKTLALHHIASNSQRFLEVSYRSSFGVTAVAVSSNRKFIAIAEGGSQVNPQIQIVDTVSRKCRKLLSVTTEDLGSDRFMYMGFSADGRHLVTQGGQPEWKMLYWNWERSKPLASVSLAPLFLVSTGKDEERPGSASQGAKSNSALHGSLAAVGNVSQVTCITICPQNPLLILVSGLGLLRFYKYLDGTLQAMPTCGYPRERQEQFTCHAWVTGERAVAATKKGDLILLENGRFVTTIISANPAQNTRANFDYASGAYDNSIQQHQQQLMQKANFSPPPMVTCLCPTSTGFIAGTDKGTILMFEAAPESILEDKDESLHYYNLLRTLRVPRREKGEPLPPNEEEPIQENSAIKPDSETSQSVSGAIRSKMSVLDNSSTQKGSMRRLFNLTTSDELDSPKDGNDHHNRDDKPLDFRQASSFQFTPTSAMFSVPPYSIERLVMDQSEENIALATHCGRIYGMGYRQDWKEVDAQLQNQSERGALYNYPNLNSPKPGSPTKAGVLPTQEQLSYSASLFKTICQPFHTGKINGMSCSVRKPLLMTSSGDGSVRLWNLNTFQQEICQYFPMEPGAVALHPSGLMTIICFTDKVKIMSVLWNGLRDLRTINFRHVYDARFSAGGQYFALAHGNIIDIYSSITLEPHGQLRGHPQKIKDFMWCSTTPYPTDNRMITCSLDGMIIDWNVTNMAKEIEHTDKRYQYMTVASDDKTVWAVGQPTTTTMRDSNWKSILREIDRHNLSSNVSSGDYEFTETMLTSLSVAPHQRLLFGGGDDGSIKCMSFPLQAGMQEPPITAHAGRVVRTLLSYDESTLFTASTDGSLFIFDVREDGLSHTRPTSLPIETSLRAAASDDVLVTQVDVEEQTVNREYLKRVLDKLKTLMDSEEKRRNHEQGTRMREKAEEYKSEAAALEAEYASVWNAKAEQERSFVAVKLQKESEAAGEMEAVELRRQKKVQALEEKCLALEGLLEKEKAEAVGGLLERGRVEEKERKEEAARLEEIMAQRHEAMEKMRKQVIRSKQSNSATLRQLEVDTDGEAESIRLKQVNELMELRGRYLRMKGESAIMRKNAVQMEKEMEVRLNEIRLLENTRAALTGQLNELHQQITQLHQDMDERDLIIGEKEKQIYELKKDNQELEKFRFVLDYRIRQLKSQMEPKQREIAEQNLKIQQKNTELESHHKNNLLLRENIEDLKKDLSEQQTQIRQTSNKIKDIETYKTRVQTDVGELAPALQEQNLLRTTIDSLYERHVVARGGRRAPQVDAQIKEEFASQLEYLSTSVEALRRKMKTDEEMHKKEVAEMMAENVSLIQEIQQLREEIRQLRTFIAAEDAARRTQNAEAKSQAAKDKKKNRKNHLPPIKPNSERNNTTPHGIPSSSSAAAATFPQSAQASAFVSIVSGGDSTRLGPETKSTTAGKTNDHNRPPLQTPPDVEENRAEIRVLRAYIDSIQRKLAEHHEMSKKEKPIRTFELSNPMNSDTDSIPQKQYGCN